MSRFPTGVATPTSVVNALKAAAGAPPKVRASFAKGRCVRGTYAPSDRAAEITKSQSFTRPSRVLARFFGEPSEVADPNRLVLCGFSFKLGDDNHRSDILAESAPVHFARTLDQMLAFLEARVPGPDGKPDLAKVRAFSAANPETVHQANYIATRPLTGSLAGTTYWAVHTFPATNAKGETRFIKFKVVPVGGEVTLTKSEAKAKSADFLHDDLKQADRRRGCPVQRDGAARPSRRSHHGRDPSDGRMRTIAKRCGSEQSSSPVSNRTTRATLRSSIRQISPKASVIRRTRSLRPRARCLRHFTGKASLTAIAPDQVSLSGVSSASRRHAPGLTPTTAENTSRRSRSMHRISPSWCARRRSSGWATTR